MLRAGNVVRIEASGKIRYGLMEHDASGDRALATPADYAFPAQRPYSLVYRVGTQLVQGEDGPVLFTVAGPGPLEICVNDHPSLLNDNTGSIFLQVAVNEPVTP